MECDGAMAWRSVLRVKLFGQLAGLVVSVGSGNALGGASCIAGADVAFWALGGGAKRFECDEQSERGVRRAPIGASLAKALLMSVNAAMLLSVLASCAFGQSSPLLRRVKKGELLYFVLRCSARPLVTQRRWCVIQLTTPQDSHADQLNPGKSVRWLASRMFS